ncbi:MAG: DUF1992 domain-containing protein [Armatimonadetes bacterium]|nr:DUF1992 domain-containing protein [Armatimonadota bacterium]
MSWFEIIAERKIRDAQEEGAFDNLPGRGRPVDLDVDPRIPPEQRAAYRILKEARYVPEWIALDNEIRRAQTAWEEQLLAFEREWSAARTGTRAGGRRELDQQRDAFLLRAARGLRELNRQVDRFNLLVPILSRCRARLPAQERLEELEQRFPRLSGEPGPPVHWREILREERAPTRLSNRMPRRAKRESIG